MNNNPAVTVDLSIIIVTWNVWPLLRACLQSLHTITAPDPLQQQIRHFGPLAAAHTVEVIVVDSAGSDETPTRLPAEFPWVRFLRSEKNVGFTGGNNLGYAMSRGDTILFLNPDTTLFAQERAATSDEAPVNPLWQLYQTLTSHTAIGMVGPQLRYDDGSWQNSRRHLPTPLTGFWESTWLGQLWPNNPWARDYHMADWPATFGHDVAWLNGSAMFARRAALQSIMQASDSGPFDEAFFMYSEELDLCHRLRLAGWRIVYEPAVLILHYEGRSSEQAVATRHIRFNRSKVRYYKKYFGWGWAWALRHYLLFEFRVQLLIETIKLRLGHKPALRKERIAVYQEVLRSQLDTG